MSPNHPRGLFTLEVLYLFNIINRLPFFHHRSSIHNEDLQLPKLYIYFFKKSRQILEKYYKIKGL